VQEFVKVALAEVRGAWRYRWYAMGVAWAVCILGWLAVYFTPDQYEARSRFYVDTSSALAPFVRNLSVEMDVNQQVDLVRQAIVGREALLNVARETDLDIKATTPIKLEALLESLREDIVVTGGAPRGGNPRDRDNNFEISFRDTDRERAVKVVQIVLDTFIEGTLQKRRTGFETARDFLEQQIHQQEQRLAEAEQKLAEFKRRNIGRLPTEQGSYVDNLQLAMTELQNLRSQESVLLSRRQQLTAQLAVEKQYVPSGSVVATPGGSRPASSGDLDARIRESEARLEELLLVYTPKHPEVIALEEALAQLRAKRREELTAMGVTGIPEGGSLAANPVHEQIRVQRNEVDVELAAIRGQISDRSRRIADMQARVETMPEVEAELAQLTRDYDVLRTRYGEMLQQFETAKLSDAVGQKDQVEFSVLDPPAALAQPVAPPRLLLLLGVLALGLGAGGAAAVVMSRLNPVFDSLTTLRDVTGLPILGAISATWLDQRAARRRAHALQVALSGAALLVVFVVVVVGRDVGSQFLTSLIRG
jgi:polysaccharide chain length determinant protein (PEP-CTERM system associated)